MRPPEGACQIFPHTGLLMNFMYFLRKQPANNRQPHPEPINNRTTLHMIGVSSRELPGAYTWTLSK
jgi:hypothetical protein